MLQRAVSKRKRKKNLTLLNAMIQELSAPLVFFLHFKTNMLQWEAQKYLLTYSIFKSCNVKKTQLQLSAFMV